MDLKELLHQSLNYPSGDNCQPFRFRLLSENLFEIYHDGVVAAHKMNSFNRASLISLGALIETISLVANKHGQKIKVEILIPNPTKFEFEKWAKITLENKDESKGAFISEDFFLCKALSERAVDRGLYSSEKLPSEVIDWLETEAKKNSALRFSFYSQLPSNLKSLLLTIEQQTLKNATLCKDILKWIRFTDSEAKKTRNGLPWSTLKLSAFQKPILKLFSLDINIYKVAVWLGSTQGNKAQLKKMIQGTGGFGWISLSSAEPTDIVNAGRTIMRMWLYLNSKGFAFQPMTLATLPCFQSHFGGLPTDWDKNLIHRLYPELTQILQQNLGNDKVKIPLWGFRTGKSKPLTEAERSLRYDLEKVLISA